MKNKYWNFFLILEQLVAFGFVLYFAYNSMPLHCWVAVLVMLNATREMQTNILTERVDKLEDNSYERD